MSLILSGWVFWGVLGKMGSRFWVRGSVGEIGSERK